MWTQLAGNVHARVRWKRAWAVRERLAFLRQFDPKDIYYFAKDGLEHWSEPYATLSYTYLHAEYRQDA